MDAVCMNSMCNLNKNPASNGMVACIQYPLSTYNII